LLVNDTEAFIECAVQGHGMILVGGASVQSQMASGALQRILAQVAFCPLPLSVMYPDRQYLALRRAPLSIGPSPASTRLTAHGSRRSDFGADPAR
jgi:DNA-binding transcriptional LysR family regulator